MNDMAAKQARPPDGSASAIRAAEVERPKKPTGREYTPEYKQRILREIDELRISGDRGDIGALLRREGLFQGTVQRWRNARERAEERALMSKKRGRKPTRDPVAEENERLRTENERLHKELQKAAIIIDVQKKLAALLGIEAPEVPDPNKDGTP
jgi:transposase-like protein